MNEDFVLPVKKVEGETVKERLTENVYERIMPARYLSRDEKGEIQETPKEMFLRVAKNVAKPDKDYMDYEKAYKQYFDLMTEQKFMPNSPTLMNAGDELQQLSACFVIHPEDSMESIFQRIKDAALIFKSGGGVGYPFHLLRPKGDKVSTTGGISSGPISFMKAFDTMCGTIKQGGKRRGAQMGIMKVDHPDVLRFVVAKRDNDVLNNFNISVGVTEEFMEAVKKDEEFALINPSTGKPHIVNETNQQFYNSDEKYWPQARGSDSGVDKNFWRDYAGEIEGVEDYHIELEKGEVMKLPARFIFDCMVDGAWKNGEPGLFMYDEYNNKQSFDVEKHPEYTIEATNPCGEQGLLNGESCNLGHVNLSLMVEDKGDGKALTFKEWKERNGLKDLEGKKLDEAVSEYLEEALDLEELERVSKIGTRFLDNVISMNNFPLDEIEKIAEELRKIGLGIMGFAQMLMQLGIPYGSEESFSVAKEVQRLVTKYSVEQSAQLAEERGEFPDWEKSKWADPTSYPEWFKKYSGGKDPEKFENGLKLRNHNTTTIAPTGTTSMIADTSGGCEPIFSLAYFKNVGKDIQGEDMLVEFDDYFIRTLRANGLDVEEVKEKSVELMNNNEWDGVNSIPDEVLPEEAKRVFVTADSVSPREHVMIQASFQEYNHSGISKTCNFPNEATRDDIREAYMKAYEEGCKGVTVYRDGSRDIQVLQTGSSESEEKDADEIKALIDENFESIDKFLDELDVSLTKYIQERNRPQIISGTTQKVSTGYGGMYVTINEDGDGMFEVFTQMGKSGGFTRSFTEAVSRLVSLSLRSGVSEKQVIRQLDGIRSPKLAWDNGEKVLSIPDGIAKAMKRYKNGEASSVQSSVQNFSEEDETEEKEVETETVTEEQTDVEKLLSDGKSPECPECGSMLTYSEGCIKCGACGYSECG